MGDFVLHVTLDNGVKTEEILQSGIRTTTIGRPTFSSESAFSGEEESSRSFFLEKIKKFLRKMDILQTVFVLFKINELLRIEQSNLFESFGLFKVNSECKPEIQIKL